MSDDCRILSIVKKIPFTEYSQVTLQEVGISFSHLADALIQSAYIYMISSKSTIKRRLHESKYRGFTTRYKPIINLKNRKARLEMK